MHFKKRKSGLIITVFIYSLLLLLFTHTLYILPSGPIDGNEPLTWSLNIPLYAGSMLTDKIQQSFADIENSRRNSALRIVPVSPDESAHELIITYNHTKYQIIQVRTSPLFNRSIRT